MIIATFTESSIMIKTNTPLQLLSFFLLLVICCLTQPAFSQKIKDYDLVRDFKAVGDDKTDNYLAFQKAAQTISKAGGGRLNIPKGKYYIDGHKGSKKNHGYHPEDIVFRNCNNLTVIGNNSVIRMNGKFRRLKDIKVPGTDYYLAINNTVCPFKIMNSKNVLLKDMVLYGEVDKMTKEWGLAEGESYGVFINDEEPQMVSSNIVLQNITAHHFAADGFLIRCNGQNITLNNCYSYKNARQGLSIVKGNDIKVLNSSFDSTGVTGGYGWHAPGAGIDIENEFGAGKLNNVTIRNCNFRGNNGFQIVTTLQSHNVIIDSCFISDPTAGYSVGTNGVGMFSLNSTLSNSIIFGTIQVDISDQGYTGPVVQEIKNNIIYSGFRAILSADYGRPVNITGNIIIMLPKPKLDEYFPYIQNPNCVFNRNIIAVHADRIIKEPNQVVPLVQLVKEVKEDFWLVYGYTIPLEKQGGVYYLPATNGSKVVKDHFFGNSFVVSKYDFAKTHFLKNEQVNRILNTALFTATRQKGFDRKYLIQANAVRAYTSGIVAAATRK